MTNGLIGERMYDILFFAAIWASSMCVVLYKMHSRFEQVWQAMDQLDAQKQDVEP